MWLLSRDDVLRLHERVIATSGGAPGLRDPDGLDSAVAQPGLSFGGTDLYPTPVEKAAALGFSLIGNHPFIDGNKRIGHAAIELFLVLNGFQVAADVDEQEAIILDVAAGRMSRETFVEWLRRRLVPR